MYSMSRNKEQFIFLLLMSWNRGFRCDIFIPYLHIMHFDFTHPPTPLLSTPLPIAPHWLPSAFIFFSFSLHPHLEKAYNICLSDSSLRHLTWCSPVLYIPRKWHNFVLSGWVIVCVCVYTTFSLSIHWTWILWIMHSKRSDHHGKDITHGMG
jgi:hypothetical protein